MSREDLVKSGARAQIRVIGESVRGTIRVIPGFWSAKMGAEITIVAVITVDGRNGRLLGKTLEGTARAETDAGAFCAGGGKAVAEAAEEAMKNALRHLGEELTNSDRVRSGRTS